MEDVKFEREKPKRASWKCVFAHDWSVWYGAEYVRAFNGNHHVIEGYEQRRVCLRCNFDDIRVVLAYDISGK